MNLPAISTITASRGEDISKILNLAVPVVAIFISLVILALLVWPKFNETMRFRAANQQLAILSSQLEDKSEVLKSFDRDGLEKQLGEAEALLPSDKELFTFLAQIENAGATSGIIINKTDVVKPGGVGADNSQASSVQQGSTGGSAAAPPPSEVDPIAGVSASKVQLKLNLTGDYRSLLQFFNNVYGISRATNIKDLVIAASSQGSGQITANFSLEAFWQAIPSELAPVETPVEIISANEIARLNGVIFGPGSQGITLPSVPVGRTDLFQAFPE